MMRNLRIPLFFLGLGLVAIHGCDEGPGNTVTGRVTLAGQPVAGSITFTAKGKDVTAGLGPDGSYKIEKATTGPNTITIQGLPEVIIPDPLKGKEVPMPEMPGPKGPPEIRGIAPPKRYETKDGGLTFDVKAGKNIHDVPLEP